MKKTAKKLLCMLLVLSMVLCVAPLTALATELEVTLDSEATTEAIAEATETIDLSAFKNVNLLLSDDVEIDEEDPAIIAVEAELDEILVLNAEGTPAPLTEAEKQQVLGLYQQYLDHWKANANLLGVQTPFFLSYNDNTDELGVLGEMLVMAGISVDTVRAGYMTVDDLTGMIQNFLYGDMLGIQLYGNAIAAARDEALQAVEDSGAQTEAQKLLVLNDWLAHNATFDMTYIMNADKDTNGDGVVNENDDNTDIMVAEDPQPHKYYDTVYDVIYDQYQQQLEATFRQQIIDGLKAQMKQQYYEELIAYLVSEMMTAEEAEAYLAANEEAIAADAVAFVDSDELFQTAIPVTDEEGNPVVDDEGNPVTMTLAEQAHASWDAFWADCEENGIEMPVTDEEGNYVVDAEGNVQTVRVPINTIVDQQMDTPMDDLGGMTPNDAIPVFADQAAVGLTEGVLDYWEGSHIGVLGDGYGVCLGYTKAFTYLVQYMRADIYGVNGAGTDMSKSENWKTAEELYYTNGALDTTKNYVVDSVRITFDASVTMYGETQANFNSDHFWNAVQLDGKWYYVDSCYTDVYTEVMMRDRVETDGSMNHMYFMFSHTTAADLYEGNYKEIKTLYETSAVNTDYEDSWMSRIKSNVYSDGTYFYYSYDSTDLITIMEDYENDNLDYDSMDAGLFKIVRHKLTGTDAGTDGDRNYEALIEFNYKADEEDEESIARVYNPVQDKMVENVLLTNLYARHTDYEAIYPSLALTSALYNGKIYFNLANCVLSYDLETGAVVLVKEYNTVSAVRDKTNGFGGMAFSVCDEDEADFTVKNHPIAGLTVKADGNLYVSIATNFAFISGKDPHDSEDQSSYGYEFEESNYNPDYSSYGDTDDDLYESLGYTKEINDNDEFMWSANFVETLSMSHLAGTSHRYGAVSVEATCGIDAYTENRCTTCGASEDGTRVEEEGTACAHHYVYFEEEFYTVNEDNGNWNTGSVYVCTECGFHIAEPVEPEENSISESMGGQSYEEQMERYEEEKAIYDDAVATAGHTYAATNATWASDNSSATFSTLECDAVCTERKNTLDCLLKDNTLTVELDENVTLATTNIGAIGTCPEGATIIYGATGEAEVEFIANKPETITYTVSKGVEMDPTDCKFENCFCTVCGNSTVHRVKGSGRCETAYEAADALKEVLGVDEFDAVIIASGENFADALAGSYLAAVKDAPILLYRSGYVNENVDYITKNMADDGTVYILGGTAAVPQDMEDALAGYTVERLSGKTRFDTNLAILTEAGITGDEVLVCTGWNFADSLSASATGLPILMVDSNSGALSETQIEFLEGLDDDVTFTIIGGEAAVSADMATAIEAYGEVTRVKGATREETSVEVAKKYFRNVDTIVLAYSRNFPDGLCGGPLAYAMGAPLILTNAGAEAAAVAYVEDNGVTGGLIMGGSGVVSEETAKTVFGITSDKEIPSL